MIWCFFCVCVVDLLLLCGDSRYVMHIYEPNCFQRVDLETLCHASKFLERPISALIKSMLLIQISFSAVLNSWVSWIVVNGCLKIKRLTFMIEHFWIILYFLITFKSTHWIHFKTVDYQKLGCKYNHMPTCTVVCRFRTRKIMFWKLEQVEARIA